MVEQLKIGKFYHLKGHVVENSWWRRNAPDNQEFLVKILREDTFKSGIIVEVLADSFEKDYPRTMTTYIRHNNPILKAAVEVFDKDFPLYINWYNTDRLIQYLKETSYAV